MADQTDPLTSVGLLAIANVCAALCEDILKERAHPQYLVERDFLPFFRMLQNRMGPFLYHDGWKPPEIPPELQHRINLFEAFLKEHR